MSNYEILGVSENVSEEELKKAYKYLCKQYHPDVFSGDKAFAEKKMKELNQAYDAVLNEIKNSSQDAESYRQDYSSPPESNKNYSQPKSETQKNNSSTESKTSYSSSAVPEQPKKKSGCGCFSTIGWIIVIGIIINVLGLGDEAVALYDSFLGIFGLERNENVVEDFENEISEMFNPTDAISFVVTEETTTQEHIIFDKYIDSFNYPMVCEKIILEKRSGNKLSNSKIACLSPEKILYSTTVNGYTETTIVADNEFIMLIPTETLAINHTLGEEEVDSLFNTVFIETQIQINNLLMQADKPIKAGTALLNEKSFDFESLTVNGTTYTIYADSETGNISYFDNGGQLEKYAFSKEVAADIFDIPNGYQIMNTQEYVESGKYYEMVGKKGEAYGTEVELSLYIEHVFNSFFGKDELVVYIDDKKIGEIKADEYNEVNITTAPGEHILKFVYKDISTEVGIFIDEYDTVFEITVENNKESLYLNFNEFLGASAYYRDIDGVSHKFWYLNREYVESALFNNP